MDLLRLLCLVGLINDRILHVKHQMRKAPKGIGLCINKIAPLPIGGQNVQQQDCHLTRTTHVSPMPGSNSESDGSDRLGHTRPSQEGLSIPRSLQICCDLDAH
jgi:hypothetical protein